MRGEIFAVGVGAQCPLFKFKQAEFFAGSVVGYGSYENPIRHTTYRGLIGLPFVGVRHEGVSLNLGFVPLLSNGHKKMLFTLSVGIEFW